MDQADTLRRLMQQRLLSTGTARKSELDPGSAMSRVMTVASGKGGVGKSCFVATMGTLLARQGLRVMLIDGDFGLANLDIMLGVSPEATLDEVLDGAASLQSTIIGVEPNLWLLPSASGFHTARGWDGASRMKLASVLEACPWEMDLILIDAGAGIQDNVLSLHRPAYDSLVVMTPEPTSLTDAYGLIKTLRKRTGIQKFQIIVNQVTDGREGHQTFQKLKDVASRFIDVELEYFGHWQRDEKISKAVMNRKILLDLDPDAPSIPSLELLAKRIRMHSLGWGTDESHPVGVVRRSTAGLWTNLLGEVKA